MSTGHKLQTDRDNAQADKAILEEFYMLRKESELARADVQVRHRGHLLAEPHPYDEQAEWKPYVHVPQGPVSSLSLDDWEEDYEGPLQKAKLIEQRYFLELQTAKRKRRRPSKKNFLSLDSLKVLLALIFILLSIYWYKRIGL
jgi:hypothetical protein